MSGVPQPKQGTKPPAAKKPIRKTRKSGTNLRAATELHSKIIRAKGHCEAAGMYGLECSNVLNCCHIIRRARSGVRTDLSNAFCACTTHHAYLDSHILDLIYFVGKSRYERLQQKADQWTKEAGSSHIFWADERSRLQAIADEMGIV